MATTIEQTAKQWIDDEFRQQSTRPGATPPTLQLSPASWVLPKLLRIIYQNTDQPVEVLAPLIRTMLHEQAFATTGGDPCDTEQIEQAIDQTVSVLIRVLERVRQYRLTHADAG